MRLYLTHQFVWCRLFLQYVFWAFFSLVFSVPAKEGKVSPGRLVDSYPGDSIHQRGYFLHCFLPSTSFDFPLFGTLGYRTSGFVMDRCHYTDRTAPFWHFTLTLHFVARVAKKEVKNSGCPLLEEQKHFILGSQTSTCLKLPPFWTCQHCEISSCKIRAPCVHLQGTEQAGSSELFLQVGLGWGSINVYMVASWNEKPDIRVGGHLT